MKVPMSYIIEELAKLGFLPRDHTEAVRAYDAIIRPTGSWAKPTFYSCPKKCRVRIKKSARIVRYVEIKPLYS